MKHKGTTLPVDPETLAKIGEIINIADECANAFRWTHNGSAALRERTREKYDRPDGVFWTDGDEKFYAAFHFRQTLTRTYPRGEYYRNGVKTTLLAIRTSYKRLLEAQKEFESKNNEPEAAQ